MSEIHSLHLDAGTLPKLGRRIAIPAYDRSATEPRILHLGVGGFHRAHMAGYTDELLAAGQTRWSILGAGLTPADERMARVLGDQDCLYTLVARGPQSEEARVVGAITDYFHASPRPTEFCKEVAAGGYRIISLTVTEKGYHAVGDDRHLDTDHPHVVHDLANPESPMTAVGFLFRVAQLRIGSGAPLPTFLSCDNVPHNGSTLRRLLLEYGAQVDRETARILEDSGRFPNSMVDRITPGTTDADRDYVHERWGIADAWPVVCEDFRQWYIEDDFAAGRPDWDEVGAGFIPDVTPYELMKIRLLNGSHSALAYLSYLLGYRRVDLAMADPDVLAFVKRYMAEIEPAVGTVPGVDLHGYEAKLVKRFANPAVADQVLRLCEDGSSKLPNMMLAPLAELAATGRPTRHGAFALAAWIRFLRGEDEDGAAIEINDPNAERLVPLAHECGDDPIRFLDAASVFPQTLRDDNAFRGALRDAYQAIASSGMRAAIHELVASA
jgi:mannitol 2-dehydrogenase